MVAGGAQDVALEPRLGRPDRSQTAQALRGLRVALHRRRYALADGDKVGLVARVGFDEYGRHYGDRRPVGQHEAHDRRCGRHSDPKALAAVVSDRKRATSRAPSSAETMPLVMLVVVSLGGAGETSDTKPLVMLVGVVPEVCLAVESGSGSHP
jgi:hypothetical protein